MFIETRSVIVAQRFPLYPELPRPFDRAEGEGGGGGRARGEGEGKEKSRKGMRTTCRRTAALCERICCRLRARAHIYLRLCPRRCVRAMNIRIYASLPSPSPPPPLLFAALFLIVFPCSFSAFLPPSIARAASSFFSPSCRLSSSLEGCRILLEYNHANASCNRVSL